MSLNNFLDGFFSDVQKKRLAWSIVTIVIFLATTFIARAIVAICDMIQRFMMI